MRQSAIVVNKRYIIGSLLTIIWIVLTGVYNHSVLTAYRTTNLANALLTMDSIFFGGIIVLISIVISMSGTAATYKPAMTIVRPLIALAGAIAILLMSNVLSYFTVGWLHTIAVYYQVWTPPALMTAFFSQLPYESK